MRTGVRVLCLKNKRHELPSISHTHTFSLFLSLLHTHTLSLFLSLSHTHILSLYFSFFYTHTHSFSPPYFCAAFVGKGDESITYCNWSTVGEQTNGFRCRDIRTPLAIAFWPPNLTEITARRRTPFETTGAGFVWNSFERCGPQSYQRSTRNVRLRFALTQNQTIVGIQIRFWTVIILILLIYLAVLSRKY